MEVRVRSHPNQNMDLGGNYSDQKKMSSYSAKNKYSTHAGGNGILQGFSREISDFSRTCTRWFKFQGSAISYLLIPALILLLWWGVCFLTTRSPSLTIEERLSQKYFKEYFDPNVYEDGLIKMEEEHHEIFLPEGQSVNVVLAMPFLDVNPLGATEYIQTLQWILTYSSVPITFHIITNTDSIPYTEKVFERVKEATGLDGFRSNIITLASIMEKMNSEICPKLTVSEEFCDILMGKMTPLLFPYLLPDLDHAVYVDRNIVFQDDVGLLYNIVDKLRNSKKAAIAMAPEQTNAYMRAFSSWQRLNPMTKLGRPPGKGRPGYNPDLIVMDLEKLRSSPNYKSYLNEIRLKQLVKNYLFHSNSQIPSMGDMVNLIAADNDSIFMNLGCEWNRNSQTSTDVLEKKFNVCPDVHHIKAWNGNPNLERVARVKNKNISVGKKRLSDNENELRKKK